MFIDSIFILGLNRPVNLECLPTVGGGNCESGLFIFESLFILSGSSNTQDVSCRPILGNITIHQG